MTDLEPTLLLTRPRKQSEAFLCECEAKAGKRITAVISPLIEIEPIGVVPDLNEFATLIFTSGNGVRRVQASAPLKSRTVVTVGEKTAELARSFGADAVALGEDVETFLHHAERIEGPALFCRGVHSRGDVSERARRKGVQIVEVVLYDQVAKPLSTAAQRLLAGKGRVIAPVFSPRSARLLGAFGDLSAPFTIVAMSKNVADAWAGPGDVVIAEQPTSAAMCEATVRLI